MITLKYRFNARSNSQIFEFPSIHGIAIVELKSILELYHFGRSSLAFETFIGKRTSYNFGVFYVKKQPNYGFSLKLEKVTFRPNLLHIHDFYFASAFNIMVFHPQWERAVVSRCRARWQLISVVRTRERKHNEMKFCLRKQLTYMKCHRQITHSFAYTLTFGIIWKRMDWNKRRKPEGSATKRAPCWFTILWISRSLGTNIKKSQGNWFVAGEIL